MALFPLLVVTVIFVVPVPTPVTFPFPSTFAMFSSSLFHVSVLSSVASLGLIVAFKVSLVPFDKVIFDLYIKREEYLKIIYN